MTVPPSEIAGEVAGEAIGKHLATRQDIFLKAPFRDDFD
jgi:hypothetical protein